MCPRALAPTPLVVYQDDPFNAETPAERLTERFLTPTGLFFVRSHAPVPRVDVESFRLTVRGMVQSAVSVSIDDLKRDFRERAVIATLECAGNRRRDLIAARPIPDELPWDAGAIGTAEWKGVALGDLLEVARVHSNARHVAMSGLDRVRLPGGETPFGASIPIEKARAAEVVLAYEMNGEPLEPSHGFPLRAVVPGYVGARSVKWLDDVVVRDTPSTNHFYASSYRLSPASGSSEPVALAEIPLNAVICRPCALQARAGDVVDVEGYAIGTGGRAVERVEVSADDARTWHRAEISSSREAWAWRFWTVRIETSPRDRELMVRAWDGIAACQPADAAAAWNPRGYLNNVWHRVPLDTGVGRKPAR